MSLENRRTDLLNVTQLHPFEVCPSLTTTIVVQEFNWLGGGVCCWKRKGKGKECGIHFLFRKKKNKKQKTKTKKTNKNDKEVPRWLMKHIITSTLCTNNTDSKNIVEVKYYLPLTFLSESYSFSQVL